MSLLDQANNPRRLVVSDDDSAVSSSACPYPTLLGGMRGWIPRDRLLLPLHGLRVSRYRGEHASLLHQEERNYTSTALTLSKTSAVLAPHPWCRHHFEGTDRRAARYRNDAGVGQTDDLERAQARGGTQSQSRRKRGDA